MNISSSFQTSNVPAVRLSINERPSVRTTSPVQARATGGDTVTLSPEAWSAAGAEAESVVPPPSEGAAPPTPPPPPPPVPRTPPTRGEALLTVLDADEDGSVTKEEFTDGALALLKREAPPRANDEGRGQRGVRGLERRLEKAFERVDGNRDGSLDVGELTAALDGVRRGRGAKGQDDAEVAPPPPPPPPPSPEPAPTPEASLSATAFSATYVSVAVQRYTSLQPPSAPRPATPPPVDPGTAPASAAAPGEIEDQAPSAPVAA